MRGVKTRIQYAFHAPGEVNSHIRAPTHQRQAGASTKKLGWIGRGKKGERASCVVQPGAHGVAGEVAL